MTASNHIYVRNFRDLDEEEKKNAGGKGSALAILYQAGFNVPDGFVILPNAFNGNDVKSEAWEQINLELQHIRKGDLSIAFAVRSSALSEDSANASFAGQFETVLNVDTDNDIQKAIHLVYQSRLSERVNAYSKEKGINPNQEMAIVIQKMVSSEISGILFTSDPVTGDRSLMVGNYTHGLGEKLVSGEVNPETFTMQRPKMIYKGPSEFKKFSKKLFKNSVKIELFLGFPQDIEWAIADGKLFVLQSRPITTLRPDVPETGEWNDTLTGSFIWTSNNAGEAAEDVVVPFTWSYFQKTFNEISEIIPGFHSMGNICGRIYFNVSFMLTLYNVLGKNPEETVEEIAEILGRVPEGITMPILPYPKMAIMKFIMKNSKPLQKKKKEATKNLEKNKEKFPIISKSYLKQIPKITSNQELISFWNNNIKPMMYEMRYTMLGPAARSAFYTSKLRAELTKIMGEEDATILISNLSNENELLESLGPVVGIYRLIKGELSESEYLDRYGHRSSHEGDFSLPRPIEDPNWVNKQIDEYKKSNIDIESLIQRQKEKNEEVVERFKINFPKKAKKLLKKIETASIYARQREFIRSESSRFDYTIRKFMLQVGKITGLGNDVFFLTIDEFLDVLSGENTSIQYIPARKETYEKYKQMHPYPVYISGRFNPEEWYSDPNRRFDYFDSNSKEIIEFDKNTISGFSGSAGKTEGIVRILKNSEEGDKLQEGEILVATSTNIGWTLLFPRAKAIITDIGAPLSHAAIVARELGIPAVVGTNNATMVLKTGDKVLVDGTQGIVKVLEKA
ncbi:PEP/pyruvate-binding domain-containing protein [Promethearchaeum syntrophicum]|uniref:PEP/pyruvate-binding domain-containing protein n=1 Tax=Promethearchaeum syntrophicum TaxID=2594042 RepID=A0A5B9DG03_9ARCH|nr:PEP/pyruvate-binding domain-containing protein [Candidatus Prometheoarchaeum syntrophicum]QEE17975.1 Phosphoenolpyruvate synthase [Candidatus Prometheoarchaeum syntrophicum]